jgi:hypothetical protein
MRVNIKIKIQRQLHFKKDNVIFTKARKAYGSKKNSRKDSRLLLLSLQEYYFSTLK